MLLFDWSNLFKFASSDVFILLLSNAVFTMQGLKTPTAFPIFGQLLCVRKLDLFIWVRNRISCPRGKLVKKREKLSQGAVRRAHMHCLLCSFFLNAKFYSLECDTTSGVVKRREPRRQATQSNRKDHLDSRIWYKNVSIGGQGLGFGQMQDVAAVVRMVR